MLGPSSKLTQLERIKYSIANLADLESLEAIEYFKYPPWTESPLRVEISELAKEGATLEHLASIASQARDPLATSIYSDTSYTPEGIGVGVGLVATTNGRNTYKGITSLGSSQLVYNRELEGVAQAFEHASLVASPGQQIRVYSDN